MRSHWICESGEGELRLALPEFVRQRNEGIQTFLITICDVMLIKSIPQEVMKLAQI